MSGDTMDRLQELMTINANLKGELDEAHAVIKELDIEVENYCSHIKELDIEVESYHSQCEELAEQLENKAKMVNAPSASALEAIWTHIFPPDYGEWEYPDQAARHIRAVYDEQDAMIKGLRGQILLLEKRIWQEQAAAEQLVGELTAEYTRMKEYCAGLEVNG